MPNNGIIKDTNDIGNQNYEVMMDIQEILSTDIISLLLADKSSGKNIIWATDSDDKSVYPHASTDELCLDLFNDECPIIKPRVLREKDEQEQRTRNSAEVYTPSWICNIQNNMIDEKWFGKANVFNIPSKHSWKTRKTKIEFEGSGKTWKEYVDAKRLEISCGEAPYIVSCYDVVTGKEIPLSNRIGLLDRKFRVINENASSDEEWKTWSLRALESVYGYEFQGDNLILARINVFLTFVSYYNDRFGEVPAKDLQRKIANIISWNFWQMDGSKYVIPYSCKTNIIEELTLFGINYLEDPCLGCEKGAPHRHNGIYCKIMDWRANKSVRFLDIIKEGEILW